MFSVPRFLTRAAGTVTRKGKVLIVVFQRGAADGLNIVVPHGDKSYYKLRPSIAIPRPKRGQSGTALDLDGRFGLHPSLAPFKKLYDDGLLAVVNATGSPDSTRSHFDAQDFMESGTPGVKSTRDGWMNRYVQGNPREPASTFRAVATTSQLPRVLSGSAAALAVPELTSFAIGQGPYGKLARQGLEEIYAASEDPLFKPTASETFEALDFIERIDPAGYRPSRGAEYPTAPFGRSMKQIAQLIKADVGLEIAFVEIGGWDHHVNEGGVAGPLANLLRQFGGGVAALARDLGDRMDDVVVLTMSEFGRTAQENGNRGTDHGHANAMFAVGGRVKGGRICGTWPGLDRDQLYEGRDLALTTDFRDVIGEILIDHLGARRLDRVFPGYEINADRFNGLV
jgi:uncharacterized protein (DUF1501 family)